MEIKKVTSEMRAMLNAPLPEKAVTQHPTKTYLSSIKAIYVVERLNDVFGVGSWKSTVTKESITDKGMVVVKLVFEIPEYGIYHESFGGNDNGGDSNKNFDLGDAFKGATTDALTKICSFLEIGISVFKGEGNGNSRPAPATSQTQNPAITEWLSEENFNIAMKADKKGILATLNAYNGKAGKGMKKEYNKALSEQLSKAE